MGKRIFGFKNVLLSFLLLLIWGCQTPQAGGPQGRQFFKSPPQIQQRQNDLGPQSRLAKGEQRVLMLAVRFPDVEPRFQLGGIKKKVMGDLNEYVKAQSYGLTWVTPHFMGWITLPDAISEYRVSPNNFRVDRRRVRKLIEDTMTEVEGRVNFSRYQHILIIPGAVTRPGKGYGMMCYCANPGMLTGVRGNPGFVTLRSKGGQQFSGGVFVGTENAPLGMFAHDFFHALGGIHDNKRLAP